MNTASRKISLLPVILVFFSIIASLAFTGKLIGRAYRSRLVKGETPPPQNLVAEKAKVIKKISLTRSGQDGCLEVTRDGIVRQFSICNETLTQANRLENPKNILELYQLASENNLSLLTVPKTGEYYKLTIETDSGTEIAYIALGGNGTGTVAEVAESISLITGDLPQPTATPADIPVTPSPTPDPLYSPTPSPIPDPFSSPTPTLGPGVIPTPTPSPTPTPTPSSQAAFTCDYTEGTGKRPYTISNIICTSEPTPAP